MTVRRWCAGLMAGLLALALPLTLIPRQALAHPHVFVTVETVVLMGADHQVTGLRHTWTFDEMYSSFAVQGLDKKGDAKPTRADLAELAKLNVESLKEFDYFTYPTASGQKIKLKEPIDYFLEIKDSLLSFTFTLPLEKPVPSSNGQFSFAVTDPSYYIALTFVNDKAVSLAAGAPKDCTVQFKQPEPEPAKTDKLAEAFAGALGPGSALADPLGGPVAVACKGNG